MKTICEFQLGFTMEQCLNMPQNAEIVAFQTQRDIPTIWAVIDPEAKYIPRYFYLSETGSSLPDSCLKYIGTIQTVIGAVYHLFEVLD